MQVNVIQTLHYYGYNVKVNKQHGSVLKRCRNVIGSHMYLLTAARLIYGLCHPCSCQEI